MKLTAPQKRHLQRFGAGITAPVGFSGSMPEKRLLQLALIQREDERISVGIGSLMMTVKRARLTDDGHRLFAALKLPPSAEMARFIGKRVGRSPSDSRFLVAAMLRGYVRAVEKMGPNGEITRWQRTDEGRRAIELFHEEQRSAAVGGDPKTTSRPAPVRSRPVKPA